MASHRRKQAQQQGGGGGGGRARTPARGPAQQVREEQRGDRARHQVHRRRREAQGREAGEQQQRPARDAHPAQPVFPRDGGQAQAGQADAQPCEQERAAARDQQQDRGQRQQRPASDAQASPQRLGWLDDKAHGASGADAAAMLARPRRGADHA